MDQNQEVEREIPDDITWEQGIVVGMMWACFLMLMVIWVRGYAKIDPLLANSIAMRGAIAGAITGCILALIIRKIRLNQYLF